MQKKSLRLALILAVGLLGVAGWHSVTLQKRVAGLEHDAHPLVDIMADYLRFTDKLYLAGEAGNWELARWYAWKLTKASFPVKASKVVEYRSVEEYDLAALTREMLDPAIAALNDAIAAENGTMFRKRHAALRDACNACHHATRHGQVHVIVPGRSAYPGQQFRPTADADGRGHDPIPAEPAKRTPDGVRR